MQPAIYAAIEYNILQPTVKDLEIEAAVRQAVRMGLGGICVPPYWVKKASRITGGVALITPIGFPFGYQRTEAKVAEMELAFADGAQEVELVINLSALKSERWNWIKAEVARFSKLVHEREKMLTVLTDAALLSELELTRLCKNVADAGADYFKTATDVLSADSTGTFLSSVRQALHPSVGLKVFSMQPTATQVEALARQGADKVCITDLSPLQENFAS